MYIVLLGPPGSGKGTQGKLIAQKIKASHLSTGDLLRDILSNPEHTLYKDIQVINEGKLVSDDIVNSVVKDGLQKPEYKNGIIFDGYPRTVAQAQALDKALKDMGESIGAVIDINVSENVLLRRLLGRRSCNECQRIFHIDDGHEKCPYCNVPLVKRDDDNEETIKERFEEYRVKTAPLNDYYKKTGANHIEITVTDYSETAIEVNQSIMERLSQLGLA